MSSRGQVTHINIRRPSELKSRSPSATRALDVLEFFGEAKRPLRAIEISKMLDMHPSTTNQLLKTMVSSAHLVFDARSKTYLPSPRLSRFSAWIGETYEAGGCLHDLVRDVHGRTHMTVTITTPNDLFMQVIDLAMPVEQKTERGLMVSVFGSVIGRAYLSLLEESELRRLAKRARVATAQITAQVQDAACIRRNGYASGPSTGGIMWSIAVPLPMQGLRVPIVLGLAGPAEDVRENFMPLFYTMKASVERWIGHSLAD